MKSARVMLGIGILIATQGYASQDNGNLWDLSLEELSGVEVAKLATGTPTPLNRAAAITTVITAKDIQAMGAYDLDQVLMSVPGLYVGRSDQGYTPQYIFRGIYSRYNPQTLFMINGVPQETVAFGNRGHVWGGMPVESIARIEVIRGPGSALYGADAFAGIINVITKSPEELQGTWTGARAGSFDTYQAWVQQGGNLGRWQYGLSLEVGTTEGIDEIVGADSQTQFDTVFGTQASLAPGPVSTGYNNIDFRWDLNNDQWHFQLGVQRRTDLEMGTGIALALDPEANYKSDRISGNLTYSQDDWIPDWELVSEVSFFHITQQNEKLAQLFPPGAFNGSFPDGVLGSPEYKEAQIRLQQYGVYSGWTNHRLRVAAGYVWNDVYETTESSNFFPSSLSPRGQVVDISDTDDIWLPEEQRDQFFLSLQDEWQFHEQWQLVAGTRYDNYSDFGETINPRAALVWLTTDNITTRLLYGRAFRAPSFSELYVTSNPVVLGDEELEPETIDTVELAFNHQIDSSSEYSINLFYYNIKDLIVYEAIPNSNNANQAANAGERTGNGLEIEFSHQFNDLIRLETHYTYQLSEDQATDRDVGMAPNDQAYGRLNWSLSPHWQLATELYWFGKIKRGAGDSREPLDSQTLWNMNFRYLGFGSQTELSLNFRNILDEEIRYPSLPQIPGDTPGPGFNANIAIRHHFD